MGRWGGKDDESIWESPCYGEQWMLVQVTVKKARNKGIKARNVEKVKRIEIKKGRE